MADHIVHEHDEPEDKHVIHEYRDSDRGVGDGILAFLILVIILAAIGLVVWRYLPSRASNNSGGSINLNLPNVNPNGGGSNQGGGGSGSGGSGNTGGGPAGNTY